MLADNKDNMDNISKVKVQLDKDIVNKLLSLKKVGDSYSDVIRRLLKKKID
jgi:predicted CopG family antitoxin